MCNLYSMTKNVDAIQRSFKALNSRVGNLPSMPGVFPDYPAPIVGHVVREGAAFSLRSEGGGRRSDSAVL